MATNQKIITLSLLSTFKDKMQEWVQNEDLTLKTELLEAINGITSFEAKIVDSLPETGEKGIIYFVPKTEGAEQNSYEEYIYVGSAFEKVGDTAIDTDAIKNEIATTVAADYIKTVDVTPTPSTDDSGVEKTTYTFSFKNGDGTEISTASVIAVTGGTLSGGTGSGGEGTGGSYELATPEKDGLMSKEDKAKLDSYVLVTNEEIEQLFAEVTETTETV